MVIIRVVDLDEPDDDSSESETERHLPPPKPASCAKVGNCKKKGKAITLHLFIRFDGFGLMSIMSKNL